MRRLTHAEVIGNDVGRQLPHRIRARLRTAEQRRLDVEAVDLDVDGDDLAIGQRTGTRSAGESETAQRNGERPRQRSRDAAQGGT